MRENILVAGPCAVENRDQLLETASLLSEKLAEHAFPLTYLRAGVWKPRTDPLSFAGAGEKALPWLREVQEITGIPVCVEIAKPAQFALCEEFGITAFWIGARTTVNPFWVDELCQAVKGKEYAIMVKNPIVPDLRLWIGAIERFQYAGVEKIFAIHRGFSGPCENIFRNAPGWEIPIGLKVRFPDIPLLCDISHIAGDPRFLREIAQEALDYNFNGLMVEAHAHPREALSDARQQLTPEELATLLESLDFKKKASSTAAQELLPLRRNIESVDRQIARLLAKRTALVDEIASLKRRHGLPIVDPEQFQKVIAHYQNEEWGDDPDARLFLTKFLELLHHYSIKRQQKTERQ